MNAIGKQHFTCLYSPARDRAFTKRNILAGWSKGGLFPLNPQRVLEGLEDPYAKLVQMTGRPLVDRLQNITPRMNASSLSPVTPVTAETFTFLHNVIVEQDACALGNNDKQRLDRHLQKLAKAAQTFLAKNAIQEDHIRFLLKINDESKVRRAAKSIVLGKAKVMSFEDLVEARSKRHAQEKSKADKSKRGGGGKRGDIRQNARRLGPNAEAEHVEEEAESRSDQSPTADQHLADCSMAPCPGKAPTARMW